MKSSPILILPTLLFLIVSHIAQAQTISWQPASGPYGGRVLTLLVLPNDIILAGTSGGGLFRSLDNGETWIRTGFPGKRIIALIRSKTNAILASVQPTEINVPAIYRSQNNGETWDAQNYFFPPSSFAQDSTSILYAGFPSSGPTVASVYYSENDGRNWSPCGVGPGIISDLTTNPRGILFAATNSGVARSTDKGQTWNLLTNGIPATYFFSIFCVSDSLILAGTYTGAYKSTNNGNIWYKVGDFDDIIQSFAKNSTGQIFAALEHFGVLRSLDEGETWLDISYLNPNFPGLTQGNIFSLATNASGDLFAGTYGDGVFSLTKNHTQWRNTKKGLPAQVNTLVADSQGIVYAGTEGGGVHRTTDKGSTWIQSINFLPDSYPYVRALIATSNGSLFAGTGTGGVYKSTNQGQTWLNTGLKNVTVTSLSFDSFNNLFATTNSGIFRSHDSGLTWISTSNGLSSFFLLGVPLDMGQGQLFLTSSQGLFTSTNQGDKWTQLAFADTVLRAIFLSRNSKVLVSTQIGPGQNGLFESLDTCKSWRQVAFPPHELITTFTSDKAGNIFALGGSVWYSSDEGKTWISVSSGLSVSSLTSLVIAPDGHSYTGTFGDGVYRSQSAVTLLQNDNSGIPHFFLLSQNYPNPFNPSTIIEFVLPRSSLVSLHIYDLIGRQVAELVNEWLESGSYKSQWNGTGWPSGAYLYQLKVADRTETRKLLLLR